MSHHDVTRCVREQRVIHPLEYLCRNVRQLSEFATVRSKTDLQFIAPRIERAVYQRRLHALALEVHDELADSTSRGVDAEPAFERIAGERSQAHVPAACQLHGDRSPTRLSGQQPEPLMGVADRTP